MNEAFHDFFKSQGVELAVEWKTVLRKIKTTTDYDVFCDKWDANLNLLSSIIKEYDFLPFTNHNIDFDIQEDCFRIVIETKEFTISIEPDCIEFYGDDFDIKVLSVDDLKMFFSKIITIH